MSVHIRPSTEAERIVCNDFQNSDIIYFNRKIYKDGSQRHDVYDNQMNMQLCCGKGYILLRYIIVSSCSLFSKLDHGYYRVSNVTKRLHINCCNIELTVTPYTREVYLYKIKESLSNIFVVDLLDIIGSYCYK